MSDRVVYVCGCDGDLCATSGSGGKAWSSYDCGRICAVCGRNIRAYNLDAMARVVEAARKWGDSRSGGTIENLCSFDRLVFAIAAYNQEAGGDGHGRQ